MFSNTVFNLFLFGLAAAQNGAWVPEPLPAVTPPDVVNLLIQDAADGAGDYVASVIGADATAATYLINCNPNTTRPCGFDSWTSSVIITQGFNTMHWTYAETGTDGFSLSEWCTFDGTTASTATCTNSWGDEYSPETDAYTTETQSETRTYDGRLGHYSGETYSFVDYENSLWGPPPFIPVQITAGLASLSAFRDAAATTTSDISATGSVGSLTKSTTGATITSAPKVASSTSVLISASVTGTAVGSGAAKGSTGHITRSLKWALGAAFGPIVYFGL